MTSEKVNQTPIWQKLKAHAEFIKQPENHLKYLVKEKERLKRYSIENIDFFYDFSRQRVDDKAMDLLYELAETRQLRDKYIAMVSGEKVNVTENRPALHTAARNFSANPIMVDGVNIMPEINAVSEKIKFFSEKIHSGKIKGSTGKRFKHIVVTGIGGSYLGTEFVSTALSAYADKNIKIHFLSNVDSHNFETVRNSVDPETTLWVIISKSFRTVETLANAREAKNFMVSRGLDPSKHFVTVTSKESPGNDPSNPSLETFHMFDFIGGRYSVTSAVGGVPLSLYIGYDKFERFLNGAWEMDVHSKYAPVQENLPLVAALIGIWNNNFLGYHNQAIIPYASPLCKLAPHIQQLFMESNGKSVTTSNENLDEHSGVIVFGEPGTNAQHSFFQLAHQGHPFPMDFIGVLSPQYPQSSPETGGVNNHQELWANLISQPIALAIGKEDTEKPKMFTGNRPSSTIVLNDLSPANIGRLLAFYEAQTVYKAFVWDINPFDQFGVELGKTIANDIRSEILNKNENPLHKFDSIDPVAKHYLETLFRGRLSQN